MGGGRAADRTAGDKQRHEIWHEKRICRHEANKGRRERRVAGLVILCGGGEIKPRESLSGGEIMTLVEPEPPTIADDTSRRPRRMLMVDNTKQQDRKQQAAQG